MDYFTLKWIHILSSTLLLGTGLGIAFFMWMAHLSRDARAIAAAASIDGKGYAALSDDGRDAVYDLLAGGHYQLVEPEGRTP